MAEQLGRQLAEARRVGLRPRIGRAAASLGRPATLAVLATEDPVEQRFVRIKQSGFREAGLELVSSPVPRTAGTTEMLERIAALNADPAIDGIFLQFPLPLGVEPQRCADALVPRKDIDASGNINLGRLLAGGARYRPAAPAAVLALLDAALGSLRGRSIIVVGAEQVVERCIVLLGVGAGATLCILPPDDPTLPDAAAGADAVVITGDVPPGDALRHAKSGAVLLDAGYFLPPRPAGWLPARITEHSGTYLPQYGNVGPLTVSFLMESVLAAALPGEPS